jgi:omega-6 fatty acid desaturase (delta-12 desaturase)
VSLETSTRNKKPAWVDLVKPYQKPDTASIWQIINSFVPFFALVIIMYFTLSVSYLITLPLSLIAAGFLVRIFIIQHDCGHGSFFKSKRYNSIVGNLCSILTLTPYEFWRRSHAIHHAHNGDLNHRGTGDVYTMTFQEYHEASKGQRLGYRIYRHPIVMFLIGPLLMFVVLHRSPFALKHARSNAGKWSIIRLDLFVIGILVLAATTIGLKSFFLVWFPTALFTGMIGVWMFYVQHQFEDVYWSQDPDWDYGDAALKGSTYYKLPKIFQWFSGNIGLHHIHHLSPMIPNYKLQSCHDDNPMFQEVVTLTFWDSIKIVTSGYAMWDQNSEKLISFRHAHRMEKEMERIGQN